MNIQALNNSNQILQACLDIFELRFSAPMLLGRKVNNEARILETVQVVNKHLSETDLFVTASCLIGAKVFWKCPLELECNAFSHNTHGIDRVYKDLSIG